MKVQIEDNLFIETDSMQYIVKEYTGNVSKEGREDYKTHGYYPTLEGAVKKVSHMKIQASTATTLQELLTDVKSIREYIESKINV